MAEIQGGPRGGFALAQPPTTGVFRVETFDKTDLSILSCAHTNSLGVNAILG